MGWPGLFSVSAIRDNLLVKCDVTGGAVSIPPDCLLQSQHGEGPSVQPSLALASSLGSVIAPVTGSRAVLSWAAQRACGPLIRVISVFL